MLSNGLAALAKMGGQVNVGHALGASNSEEAAEYASNALQLTLTLGIIYGLVCILGGKTTDSFFPSESGTGDPGCHILS